MARENTPHGYTVASQSATGIYKYNKWHARALQPDDHVFIFQVSDLHFTCQSVTYPMPHMTK